MKIGIAINSWDEPEGILRILQGRNVYEFIDVFIIIEGRYEGRIDNPENDERIMDEIPKTFSKVHYERLEDVKQIDKRNRYWELCKELDWLIVCDTDETIDIDKEKFSRWLVDHKDYPARCFPVNTFNVSWRMARPRLFRNPYGLKHIQNTKEGNHISHGQIWDEDNKEIIQDMYIYHKETRDEYKYVDGLYMSHNKKYRSMERSIRDEVYYTQNSSR